MTLVTTVLLTGCRDGAVDDGAGFTWQEPAWVAQFRQDQEEFQLAQIACWAEFGFDKVNDPAGGVMLADFDAEQPPGWFELFESAGFECLERTKHLAWALPLPFDEEAYQRVLDTRDCLLAHGHHVSEPPTFEVWR
ncbi:MAG: hypothetical protein FWG11_00970, partial [Promicromonosporaceae bacterium]|nr:hypothetical protein [Promicromonosporaceae bacterium]